MTLRIWYIQGYITVAGNIYSKFCIIVVWLVNIFMGQHYVVIIVIKIIILAIKMEYESDVGRIFNIVWKLERNILRDLNSNLRMVFY